MYHFRNDYSEGAHPRVLEALIRTNLESTAGYGEDAYCAAAAAAIRTRFGCPSAAVHFLVGGTQTNFTAISAFHGFQTFFIGWNHRFNDQGPQSDHGPPSKRKGHSPGSPGGVPGA